MTDKEIIALAKAYKIIVREDAPMNPDSVILYFAKAVQDMQRETDSEYVRSFGYGVEGDMFAKLADAISANTSPEK